MRMRTSAVRKSLTFSANADTILGSSFQNTSVSRKAFWNFGHPVAFVTMNPTTASTTMVLAVATTAAVNRGHRCAGALMAWRVHATVRGTVSRWQVLSAHRLPRAQPHRGGRLRGLHAAAGSRYATRGHYLAHGGDLSRRDGLRA